MYSKYDSRLWQTNIIIIITGQAAVQSRPWLTMGGGRREGGRRPTKAEARGTSKEVVSPQGKSS